MHTTTSPTIPRHSPLIYNSAVHNPVTPECDSALLRYTSIYAKQIEQLEMQVANLRTDNLKLKEKCERRKCTIENLRQKLKDIQGIGIDEEVLDFANALTTSMILFQEIHEDKASRQNSCNSEEKELVLSIDVPEAPPPPLQGGLDQRKFEPQEALLQTQIRQCKLKAVPSRAYIWKREPSELQQHQPTWCLAQVEEVNQASIQLKQILIRLGDYKNDPDLDDKDKSSLIEDIKSLKTEKDNTLLTSVFSEEKFRNIKTPRERVSKLELLCREKEFQIENTLKYLDNLLQKKIESKRQTAVNPALNAFEQTRLALLMEREQIDREESIQVARELLWNQIKKSDKPGVASALGCVNYLTFKVSDYPLIQIAQHCNKFQLQSYLLALHQHKENKKLLKFDAILVDEIEALKERL